MVINIMIEIFKVALKRNGYYFINGNDLFYKGIVPSCCRLTTRHLGATLFRLRLHQMHKSQAHKQVVYLTLGGLRKVIV